MNDKLKEGDLVWVRGVVTDVSDRSQLPVEVLIGEDCYIWADEERLRRREEECPATQKSPLL